MTKNGKKSNVVSMESIPPSPPPFFSLSVIVICIFLLSNIHTDFFFQDKALSAASFYVKL